MTLPARIRQVLARRRRNPARELAMVGVMKRRQSVRDVAQQIRRELGLPDHPALKRGN